MPEVFSASTTEIPHMISVLSAIVQVSTSVKIFLSSDGIIISSTNTPTIKVSITLDSSFFSSYVYNALGEQPGEDYPNGDENTTTNNTVNINPETLSAKVRLLKRNASNSTQLNVDLTNIIDSLNIASSFNNKANGSGSIGCTLTYDGEGSPFVISFKDSLMTETCEFFTYTDVDDTEYLSLDLSTLIMEVTLSADVIFDALDNMKDLSVEQLFVYASNKETDQRTLDGRRLEENRLIFISKGDMGFSSFVFPELEQLELRRLDEYYEYQPVKNDFIIGVFPFQTIKKISKAVKVSSKIRLRKDEQGLMSIHLLTACNLSPEFVDSSIFDKYNKKLQKQKDKGAKAKHGNYTGTIIEFLLVELVVDEEDAHAEVLEVIKQIEMSGDNRKKPRRRRTSARDPEVMGKHDILRMLKKDTARVERAGGKYAKSINDILHDEARNNGVIEEEKEVQSPDHEADEFFF